MYRHASQAPGKSSFSRTHHVYSDLSYQHFILHVDLWSEDGSREVSMVKHSTHAGSASAGILVSFEDALNPNVRVPFPNTLHYGGPPPASGKSRLSSVKRLMICIPF